MENRKPVLYSRYKNYLKDIAGIIESYGVSCIIDNKLGNYVIYVRESDYAKTLDIARKKGNENMLGAINENGDERGLLASSLVYLELKDEDICEKEWRFEDELPDFLKKMMQDIETIVPFKPYLLVSSDNSLEILMNDQDNINHDEYASAVRNLITNQYSDYFRVCLPCSVNGELKDARSADFAYQEIFYSSMFLDGMFYPLGSNIALKEDCDNEVGESNYWIGMHTFGSHYFNVKSMHPGLVSGDVSLFEKMHFNSVYDTKHKVSHPVDEVDTILTDNITFKTQIEEEDNSCKITTDFIIDREASVLPFMSYPTKKSVRNGLFAFPLESGIYEGKLTEYFVKISKGTRLLHYSPVSPFFEVFEIAPDFTFKKGILPDYPKVFDDTTYDKEDKDLKEISQYVPIDPKILKLK